MNIDFQSKCDLCRNNEVGYHNGQPIISRCMRLLKPDKKITEHCEGFEKNQIQEDTQYD